MRKKDYTGKLRSIIKKNARIDYIINCIKQRKDDSLVNYVRDISLDVLHFKNPESNPCQHSCIYYIKSGNPFSGFGAELRRTLDALVFANYYNFEPVIEYTDQYIYAEKQSINGHSNPFEYYFVQTGSSDFLRNKSSYRYVEFKEEHRKIVERYVGIQESYVLNEKYIYLMGKMINKYIRLNPETIEYINISLEKIGFNNSKIIGVHYRGTDYKIGYKNHPNIVSIDDYYKQIDLMISENQDAVIFLATDEESVINAFAKKYKDKVIWFDDVFRSTNGTPVHFSENSRTSHKFNLGREIVRDIITLSKSDYLIAGLSQVSYAARFFKSSYGEHYDKIIILDKGLHK